MKPGSEVYRMPLLMAPALLVLGACRTEPAILANNASSAGNVASPAPTVVQPTPALDRAELLIAVARARSAAVAQEDDRDAQRPFDNRRFELRMRIGCAIAGPDADEAAEARFDPEQRRVSLSVAPDINLEDPLVAAIGGDAAEAAEGFWIARPELLTPNCVAGGASAAPVGLVRFYSGEEARTDRREGRPYATAVTLPEGVDLPTPGSWELVLRGRLRRHADGRSIQCRAREPNGMPICLVAVEFEEVAIEDRTDRRQLARWGRG